VKPTIGQDLLRNTCYRKFIFVPGQKPTVTQFDSNVANSPFIEIYNNEVAVYSFVKDLGNAKLIDSDPLVQKMLENPLVCMDVIGRIYLAYKNKENGIENQIKDSIIEKYFKLNEKALDAFVGQAQTIVPSFQYYNNLYDLSYNFDYDYNKKLLMLFVPNIEKYYDDIIDVACKFYKKLINLEDIYNKIKSNDESNQFIINYDYLKKIGGLNLSEEDSFDLINLEDSKYWQTKSDFLRSFTHCKNRCCRGAPIVSTCLLCRGNHRASRSKNGDLVTDNGRNSTVIARIAKFAVGRRFWN
jgi:hypothetical protein